MGGIVVHDEVDLQVLGDRSIDAIQKLAELHGAVAPMTCPVFTSRAAKREVTPWRR
jgi:hypothetical protein